MARLFVTGLEINEDTNNNDAFYVKGRIQNDNGISYNFKYTRKDKRNDELMKRVLLFMQEISNELQDTLIPKGNQTK